MPTFDLNKRYPLSWLSNESEGNWVVRGLIKVLSPSEAIVFLVQSPDKAYGFDFPSSKECLVRFRVDKVQSMAYRKSSATQHRKYKPWIRSRSSLMFSSFSSASS